MPTSPAPDYYEILGVSRAATTREVKAAYRAKARVLHPDVNPAPSAAAEFKQVVEAYQVLSTPHLRRSYDVDPRQGWPGLPEDLLTFLKEAFERDPWEPLVKRGEPQRGRDLHATMRVTLAQLTATRPIPFSIMADGWCEACEGSGKNDCLSCHGSGVVRIPKSLLVDLPPNATSGARFRVAGEGGAIVGAAHYGDLYVTLDVEPHPNFQRDGVNVWTDTRVSFDDAALGGVADIPGPAGGPPIRMAIPAKTKNGQVFRLRGHGLRATENTRGDLLVRVLVAVSSTTGAVPETV